MSQPTYSLSEILNEEQIAFLRKIHRVPLEKWCIFCDEYDENSNEINVHWVGVTIIFCVTFYRDGSRSPKVADVTYDRKANKHEYYVFLAENYLNEDDMIEKINSYG
jgi:hypothetical protein